MISGGGGCNDPCSPGSYDERFIPPERVLDEVRVEITCAMRSYAHMRDGRACLYGVENGYNLWRLTYEHEQS